MTGPTLPRPTAESVVAGGVRDVARAITLVESTRPGDREAAETLLNGLRPHTGKAWRLGISGAPGVGKSSLIEALGCRLITAGRRVAVLAVDPSSARRGGSILGDKTRMTRLSRAPGALVRPSPAGTSVGGVASRTRESILVCEAAGFDVVIVESVGVGQAEGAVAGMVDFFCLLVSCDGGDALQSIKRGVLELADAVAVTKADGVRSDAAATLCTAYQGALGLIHPDSSGWTPRAIALSAHEDRGVDTLWDLVTAHRDALSRADGVASRRAAQDRAWMRRLVEEGLADRLAARPEWTALATELEDRVAGGELTPIEAARRLLDHLPW